MILIFTLVSFGIFLYFFVFKNENYWAEKNVETGKVLPIFGDSLWLILGQENFYSLVRRLYNKLKNVRYIGVYQFGAPTLLIKSPKLIKQIFVKDFDHFVDHRTLIPDDVDEFWSSNLFFLKGQAWKNMRSKLSPTFTSSKMKSIFLFMCETAELFVEYFLAKNEEIVEFEAKDAFSRYASDIISNVAFGIQVDSLKNKENEFVKMGRKATNFNSLFVPLTILLHQFFPSIGAFFKIKILPKKIKNFYLNIVKDQIEIRTKNNIKRADILGQLLEARNEKGNENTELTDFEITSQLFVFFLGGFESTSLAMSFLAQELAENPDVQQRLIEEIDENKLENGTPSYDTIAKMTYLDMVVSETIRKWPINTSIDRECTKPYTIQPEHQGEHPVHLNVKDIIMVPVFGIHRDPQYYPDPEKFDPERFSAENRRSIDPYTYLPFGVGPRSCVGSRFALLEIKVVFFYILSNFEIVLIETTQIPLKLRKNAFSYVPKKGFNLGLRRRHW